MEVKRPSYEELEQMVKELKEEDRKRKQAEDVMLESEEKYRALIETTDTGYVIIDLTGKVLDANDAYARLTGHECRDEILGRSIVEWTAAYDKEHNAKAVEECVRQGFVRNLELDYAGLQGQIIPVEINATLVTAKSGPQTLALCRDITERKRVEEDIKDREDELASIYENAPLIMLLMDEEWKIRKTNSFTAQFVGTTVSNMLNIRCGEALRCIHALDNPEGCGFGPSCKECALRLTILNTIETGRSHSAEEISMSFSDGEKKREANFLLSTKKLVIKGQPMALVSIHDITERKQAEQQMLSLQAQLQQSQKMEAIGQLAGGVAHDFNNLLTVISVQAQLALRGLREGDPLKEKLKDIELAADQAANLTRQLLAFSRRQILEMKVINLNVILKDMEKMLRRVIGEDIELKVALADDLGMVKVDPGQMEQVIVNLAVNAKDAMPQGGKLSLETANAELDEEYASFPCRDDSWRLCHAFDN